MTTFLAEVKSWFFDRAEVISRIEPAKRQAMMKAGAWVRTTARQSMKTQTDIGYQGHLVKEGKRKRVRGFKPSPAGTPPNAIRPHDHIKRLLYFSFDPRTQSVVVGPTMLPTGSAAQRTHEFGGTKFRKRKKNPRRIIRRIGGSGEMRITGPIAPGGIPQDAPTPSYIVYAPINTQAQADRANRLNEAIYGPLWIPAEPVTYPARPFMVPAMEKNSQFFSDVFKGSISA